jgi:amidase
MASHTWQEIAQEVQDHRDRSLAEVEPPLPEIKVEDLPLNVTSIPALHLTPSEIKISETSPEKLIELLATGKLSCVEVTNAFLRRAGIAQKLVTSIPLPRAVSPLQSILTTTLPTRQTASPNYSPTAPSPAPNT